MLLLFFRHKSNPIEHLQNQEPFSSDPYFRVCYDPNDSTIENKCEGRQLLYVTKCNTNCYTRIYKDVNNGELYTMKGCNVGNQLPKDLKDSSTYNLGKILKNIKKF